jgi:predicted HicB family RNase H-like nuclease
MRMHYEIDDELHRKAKVAAATEGITLKAFLERALAHEIAAVAKAEKPKRRK